MISILLENSSNELNFKDTWWSPRSNLLFVLDLIGSDPMIKSQWSGISIHNLIWKEKKTEEEFSFKPSLSIPKSRSWEGRTWRLWGWLWGVSILPLTTPNQLHSQAILFNISMKTTNDKSWGWIGNYTRSETESNKTHLFCSPSFFYLI